MTAYAETLKILEEHTEVDWILNEKGSVRLKSHPDQVCPHLYIHGTSRHYPCLSANDDHLTNDQRDEFYQAADNAMGCDPYLRIGILKACRLEEKS